MAIIRILKWMSSACDDNAIFLIREIPRLDHCSCHKWMSSACVDNAIFLIGEIPRLDYCSCYNWTNDPHKGMPSLDVCNYSNTVD